MNDSTLDYRDPVRRHTGRAHVSAASTRLGFPERTVSKFEKTAATMLGTLKRADPDFGAHLENVWYLMQTGHISHTLAKCLILGKHIGRGVEDESTS